MKLSLEVLCQVGQGQGSNKKERNIFYTNNTYLYQHLFISNFQYFFTLSKSLHSQKFQVGSVQIRVDPTIRMHKKYKKIIVARRLVLFFKFYNCQFINLRFKSFGGIFYFIFYCKFLSQRNKNDPDLFWQGRRRSDPPHLFKLKRTIF